MSLGADEADLFRTFADNIPALAWMANADGYITWYNRRWHEYCGTTPEQMEGWGWQSVHDPYCLPSVLERWNASIRSGKPFEMTFPLRGADGVFRPFLTRVEPLRNGQGRVVRWFGTNTDVAQQLSAEAALRESEERLRIVQAAGGIGSFDYDLRKDEAICSPEYYAIFGLPIGTLINRQTWTAAIHPDDRQKALDALNGAIGERKPFDFEYRIVRADTGEVRWLAGRAAIIFDAEDRPWRYVGGNIDITGRVAAEAALRESEAELRVITDVLPVLISYLDQDQVYRFANRAYEEWFGLPRDQVIGRPMREVLGDAAYEQVVGPINEALSGRHVSFERELRYRLGGTRHVHVDYVPAIAQDGSVSGFYALVNDVSAAKRAEEAVRESEARFREQFENANDFIFTADLQMRITTCNPAVAAALGHEPETLIGHSISEFVPPEVWEQNKAMLAAKLDGRNETTRYEVEVFAPGGGRMIWEINSRLTRDVDGHPNGLHAIGRDVTERRRAEETLRESEARLRALADHLPGGMVYQIATGRDGSECRFLYVSQSHERLTGIPAEAVLADPSIPYNLIYEDDRPRLVAAEAEAIEAGTSFDVQVRFRRADGELRWCRIISAPRRQPDGSLVWDGIQIDITGQKATEAALREGEERYRTLFNSIDAGFCVVELRFDEAGRAMDYRFLEVNPAFERQTGLGDAGGKWMRELVPGHEQYWFDMYGEIARTGEAKRFESPAAALDDRWYDVYAYRVGEPSEARVAILFNDISERRRAGLALRDSEARLRELNETLEQRVEERTGELIQAQEALRQSQKLEAMGQLTGGVAHDFNNLLTPIIGSLDLLQRRGIGSEREQRLIEGALQSADRAKTLVQRLLAFARRQPLRPSAVDVGALVTGMAELIASTSGPQVKVVVDVADALPAATADANQLEMAILNLSVNARDAMPDGGTLTIAAVAETAAAGHRAKLNPGDYVRLSVADTGVGMDQATLAHAIEPFFSTKGIGKGTGLGLSMVHGLASQLGGSLAISSRPGLGTNVELWLPVSEAPAREVDQDGGPAVEATGQGTALLVDDEELVRMSTADMLSELGYRVVEASSGHDALRLLDNGCRPDVLVTDHLMPGMTGADLARTAQERRPDLPVLIVSGYAEAEEVAPHLPRLTKPFRQGDLAASMRALRPTPAGS